MFDEIVTGFRFDIGGMEMIGVDLIFRLLPKEFPMEYLYLQYQEKGIHAIIRENFLSFTYGGDCVGLAAAKVTIPKLKNVRPQHLISWQILKDGMNQIILKYDLNEFLGMHWISL